MTPETLISDSPAPLVSVIIATYNWSSVLRYALQSVLGQTFPDFELLVIGDGCTDDSADVVAAANDPRIRWHNLPQNSGSQSMPNNAGLRMARGRYIAYLGHDDIWHPTHLQRLTHAMQSGDYDLGHSLCVMIGPNDSGMRLLSGAFDKDHPFGATSFVVPSSLMHTRAAALAAGEWKDYRTVSLPVDHEFLRRLWALRKRAISVDELTVFKFNSAWRKNSYLEKPSHEQAEYFRRMRSESDFLVREWQAIACAYALGNTKSPVHVDIPCRLEDAPPGWIVEQNRKIRGLPPNILPSAPPKYLSPGLLTHSRRGLKRVLQGIARRLGD